MALNKQQQNEIQQRIGNLMTLVLRGVTLRQPAGIKVHGHGNVLFVQGIFPKEEQSAIFDEPQFEHIDLMLTNCVNFVLTPATDVMSADFKGEWPPRALIQEMERQIIVPNGAQAAQLTRKKPNGA